MSVFRFSSPKDGLPTFEDRSINEEQDATLQMMDLSRADIIGEHMVAYYVDPDAAKDACPSIAGPHVLHRFHPIVMHRGRQRAIMSNGDIHSLRD